jgi:flavin reductase (DIM6/NTAB) family NADH-FMN oxidoreductase RutF
VGGRGGAPLTAEQLFRDAMAGLVAGVAVVTARRPDGNPCGLVATSVSSFSAAPPSVLTSIGHASRCHHALVECEHFGVHLLSVDQQTVADLFAGLGDDKFAGVDWSWDEDVPALAGVIAYLRCRRSALFELYDHSILIGDVLGGRRGGGEPLVYMGRRMDWKLRGEP